MWALFSSFKGILHYINIFNPQFTTICMEFNKEEKNREVCPDCNGTGIVKEKGSVHTCWKCLQEGRLDVHSKKLPESNLKI